VSEVAAAGVASLMIPYPFAVDDHQTVNARFLAQRQAAMLVPQSELTVEGLASLLQGLDRAKLVAMALRARALARPDAAARVADVCEALAGPGKAP
jgi:UDP-N-acetylglucosamine--N-acetylmuramyl-(pentapeptide) pyrophosphoryl-undecaprenol N-acetylglucosamine transferase